MARLRALLPILAGSACRYRRPKISILQRQASPTRYPRLCAELSPGAVASMSASPWFSCLATRCLCRAIPPASGTKRLCPSTRNGNAPPHAATAILEEVGTSDDLFPTAPRDIPDVVAGDKKEG